MKKILLLGSSGQLGGEWQAFFRDRESQDVVIISFTSSRLDITDLESVFREVSEHQPDLIINCAAYTNVDQAEDNRERAQRVNATAVKNIARLCKKTDTTLIHFSTDYIFAGKEEDQSRFPDGYPEEHQADPVNWYGNTKWEGEKAIRQSGCRHLIMRISWLCGAYGSNFVTTMLRLADEHKSLDIVADQWGSPTFTDELVLNTFKLIEHEKQGTYHFTSGGMVTWADFAEAIFAIADEDVKIHGIPSHEYPTAADRPRFSKLNTGKIEQVEGVKVEDWKRGLQRLINQLNEKKLD